MVALRKPPSTVTGGEVPASGTVGFAVKCQLNELRSAIKVRVIKRGLALRSSRNGRSPTNQADHCYLNREGLGDRRPFPYKRVYFDPFEFDITDDRAAVESKAE